MIASLTLNPAIDKSIEVERLIPEKKMRCGYPRIEAGGGGINISKGIRELGGESIALFTAGGVNGLLLEQLLADQHIHTQPIQVNGNTRENFIVTETTTNREYKFVMPGASLSGDEINAVRQVISDQKGISFLVSSGSLPPGVSPTFLSEIAAIAKEKDIRFIIDTSGEPLKRALETGVYLIKPNLSELCYLVGKDYLELTEINDAIDEVMQTGNCEVMVVSMGPAGAILATKDIRKKFTAPVVKKQSTVGAGDSMLAGILRMLEQGNTLERAVQYGIACGTAATINKNKHLFTREDVEKFYNWMITTPVENHNASLEKV
jgi:6-phosphofructokinase 2